MIGEVGVDVVLGANGLFELMWTSAEDYAREKATLTRTLSAGVPKTEFEQRTFVGVAAVAVAVAAFVVASIPLVVAALVVAGTLLADAGTQPSERVGSNSCIPIL